jgi:hypothetical protein
MMKSSVMLKGIFIEVKEEFRRYIRKALDSEEHKNNYFINFL